MDVLELSQYPAALAGALRLMVGMFSFLCVLIIALIGWIYNKDRKRVDELEEKFNAVPPIVEAALDLKEQVRMIWERIAKLEQTTTKLNTEHKIYTCGMHMDKHPKQE